jgi:hypothetical protein
MAAVEFSATGGSGTPTLTLAYIDSDGVASTVTLVAQNTPQAGTFEWFPLDAGDTGVRQITSYQASATRAARQGAKQGSRYVRRADQYVHENPWPILAGGIALGVLASLWWIQRR